jgi:hypothetical protein
MPPHDLSEQLIQPSNFSVIQTLLTASTGTRLLLTWLHLTLETSKFSTACLQRQE